MELWSAIGRQLRNPHGMGGRLTGRFMRVVNRAPNQLAVDALHLTAHDVALDLGCGPGQAVALMAKQAREVHGVDQSETMLDQARRANLRSSLQGRVILKQGAFETLPYADASIDKILAANVMYFWTDIPAVLDELRRVLRPGGRVAIYVTDARSMRKWKFAKEDTHRLFDAVELRSWLQQSVFKDCAISIEKLALAGGIRGLLATIVTPHLQS